MGFLSERLRFLQPSTASLIESAAGSSQFSQLGFLRICRDEIRRGTPFPTAWRESLRECPVQPEILEPLADTLGSTGLEVQLDALSFTRSMLEERLAASRDYRDRNARMYRSMGVLCGIAIAIMLV
jgi:stage III sporulation protein AB